MKKYPVLDIIFKVTVIFLIFIIILPHDKIRKLNIVEPKTKEIEESEPVLFNVDSVQDDDNVYKPGSYTVGFSIEPGLYSIHREGGCTYIFVDGSYKFFEDSINTRLYDEQVLKVPENTVVKLYRIGEG